MTNEQIKKAFSILNTAIDRVEEHEPSEKLKAVIEKITRDIRLTYQERNLILRTAK